MSPSIISEIRKHAAEQYPNECCGLILLTDSKQIEVVRCHNLCLDLPPPDESSKNPVESPRNSFLIDALEQANAEKRGKILACYHSHPDGKASMSDRDIIACEEAELPYLIVEYPGKGWLTYAPKGFECNLVGRPFIYGFYDCFTLVRDYYRAEHGIVLAPSYYRDFGWWHQGSTFDFYLTGLKDLGFEIVQELKPGNVLLMQYRCDNPNHLGIFKEDGWMLHHLSKRASEITPYGGQWEKNTVAILRHKQLP